MLAEEHSQSRYCQHTELKSLILFLKVSGRDVEEALIKTIKGKIQSAERRDKSLSSPVQ